LAMAACGSGEGRFSATAELGQDGGSMPAPVGAGGAPMQLAGAAGGAPASGGSPVVAATGGSTAAGGAGAGGAMVGAGGSPDCTADAQCAAGERCAETKPHVTGAMGRFACLKPCHLPVDRNDTTGCFYSQRCVPIEGMSIVSACQGAADHAAWFCAESLVPSVCDTAQ